MQRPPCKTYDLHTYLGREVAFFAVFGEYYCSSGMGPVRLAAEMQPW
jgi:hypothetical protein